MTDRQAEHAQNYVVRFVTAVYPDAPQLALASFNERKCLEDATGLIDVLRRQRDMLVEALKESVQLQSHYAALLNQYDGGNRKGFADSEEWMQRIAEVAKMKDGNG